MIWTSYTDTSVTVTLYSTQYAYGQQTGQTTGRSGNCTRVTTTRTTYRRPHRTDRSGRHRHRARCSGLATAYARFARPSGPASLGLPARLVARLRRSPGPTLGP